MASSPETAPKRTGNGLNGLSQHREFLVDFVDPEFGLLDKILGCRALTKREVDRIRAKPTFQDKNEELLDCVANGHKIAELISCLRDSKQEHIVKYLEENGDYKVAFDGCWPLRKEEIKVLDINHECLVDLIETEDLIMRMFAKGVLNVRQKDFIASKATPHEKNEALLDILRRRSLKDFLVTIACLKETNQTHIAEILETKAAVVSLHANLDDTVVDLARAEDEIAASIARLLVDRTAEESSRIIDNILGLVNAKLIGAKVGNSVVLYFLCSTTEQLSQLKRFWREGRMANLAAELFNRVLYTTPKFSVTVKWNEKEYHETKKYLEGLEEHSESILNPQRQLFLELPLELQDMILQRVCLHNLTSLRDNKEIFISIAPVSFSWFQHLKKRRFISRLLRHLTVYYRSLRKRATIIRNNDEFLSEMIQPKDFPGRLKTSDCLTDLQFRCINRRKRPLHSVSSSNDVLHAVRSLDDQRIIALRECLRQTGQDIVADVLESGGVAVKATLRSEQDTNRFLTEQRFVERIDEIRRGRIPITRATETVLKRLKDRGTGLLAASHDRGIVLWVHCTSVDAFVNLELEEGRTNILEDISDMLRSSVYPGESCIFPVRTTVIDIQTFDKTFVTYTSNVNFVGSLQLKAKYFYGMATLDSRIYVLCQSPNSLNVFQDEQPFSLIEVIALEETKKPEDIGSSTKDACLYITDSGKKCLWRKSGDDLTAWLSDVDWPFTVSVLRDGRVLLPRKGQPCHVELYSRRGVLQQRIRLPSDIQDPFHAVQTRRGVLVVSHWWRDSVTEGVFAVNRDGVMVRRFLSFGPDQRLTYPRYLALDAADRVFVTDFDYNQVIQLDPDLGWMRVLLGKGDSAIIEYPERLCYDAGRQQLLVGHSGGVDVFTLRSQ